MGLISYRRNDYILVASLVLGFLSVLDYWLFFDILAPGIASNGSVRANMGGLFIIPVLVLSTVQIFFAAGVLHLVTRSFYPQKHDFLKACFCGSLLVFMYSVYYALYPSWGAYLFIIGPFRNITGTDYLVLLAWTAVTILALSYAIRAIYQLKGSIRWPVLLLLAGSLLSLVLAFAD